MSCTKRPASPSPATYRYALSFTSQFYFCGVPLRLDATPKCPLNCLYCFAMARGGRRTSAKLTADADSLIRRLTRGLERAYSSIGVEAEMIRHRMPLHVGGIGDPFCSGRAAAVSLTVLRFLSQLGYPVVISTKNPKALLDYADRKGVVLSNRVIVQVSFTTLDGRMASLIEPRAPSPKERLNCVRVLAKNGVFVAARIQPLIGPFKRDVVHELIPALGDAGCKHAVIEHMKLPVERGASLIADFLAAARWDAYGEYHRSGATLVGREWILPNEVKWNALRPVVESLHGNGMSYGAADHGLYHLGDTACCCGVDRLPQFRHWFRGNFSNVIRESPNGMVSFSGVRKHWLPTRSIREVMNSHCRRSGASAASDYLRLKWNRPSTPNAPDAFLGVRWTGLRDGNGDCVYLKEDVA